MQSNGSGLNLIYASTQKASEAYYRMLTELEEIYKAGGCQ